MSINSSIIFNPILSQIRRGRSQVRVAGLLAQDAFLLCSSFILAFALRLNATTPLGEDLAAHWRLLVFSIVLGLPILYFTHTYRDLTRYATSQSLYRFAIRSTLMMGVVSQASRLAGPQPNSSFWILYWGSFLTSGVALRVMFRDILQKHSVQNARPDINNSLTPALIYGAGESGFKLLDGLRNDTHFQIVGYLDSDTSLQGRTLHGLPIHDPRELQFLITSRHVKVILLALPHVSRLRKRELVKWLTQMHLKVLSIPSVSQLASGRVQLKDIKAVAIEDLLGREPTSPIETLITACVQSMNVLVVGAGGSIGSDICKKLIELKAKKIVMLDQNEEALYTVDLELRLAIKELASDLFRPTILPILGNACETQLLESLIKNEEIDTIYHAAAYKHVPLLEGNACSGVANNMRATRSIVNAAIKGKVRWMSLISSDKAVRPTNVMGASKRVCELIVQAAAADLAEGGPKLSIVRFGNVLGTSGSVVPLFNRLIMKGGPITVTDSSVTRYFMTRQEAVELVLQSTALSTNGGDIFLLDMGEEVKIAELARQMVELSGLSIRDVQNPDGDIEIIFTGMRAGEKLFEELFISGEPEGTQHPLIWRVEEPFIPLQQLNPILDNIEIATAALDLKRTFELLKDLVPEFATEAKFS